MDRDERQDQGQEGARDQERLLRLALVQRWSGGLSVGVARVGSQGDRFRGDTGD